MTMASPLRLLAGALSAASVAAELASTFPVETIPDFQRAAAVSLQITVPGAPLMSVMAVVPLTASQGLNQTATSRTATNIRGNLAEATIDTYVGIRAEALAYLSCDAMTDSLIDANLMLNALMENKPKAILLYSQQGSGCGLAGNDLSYGSIYTMVSRDDALATLNITDSSDVPVQAAITSNVTTSGEGTQESQNGNNSAVAMSILYSITGLITLLFLVIIATGAIRAHRYPERYGPRSAYGGRPRQSRAKGIARAVLETIPIVKFGGPPQGKPDPNIELEEAERGNNVQVHHLSTIPEDAETQPKATTLPARESMAAAAANATAAGVGSDSPRVGDEHLGCSICTEDFTVGEDVRVLPCDHKFHPPCIDPWLINVSGTCPLCRLDLRPTTVAGEGQEEAAQLPPPLEADGDGESSHNGQRRRSSRFFDLNRLRHASVEERIEVLRRYRRESQRQTPCDGAADGEDARKQSAKLSNRLRDRFRIRTRAQSPGSSRNRTGPSGRSREGSPN